MRYLASPYSHPDPAVKQSRYEEVRYATAWYLKNRIWVYSPIVHCHELARAHGMPTDAGFWKELNHVWIDRLDSVVVLMLDGWRGSVGVADEIDYASETGKSLEYADPTDLGNLRKSP